VQFHVTSTLHVTSTIPCYVNAHQHNGRLLRPCYVNAPCYVNSMLRQRSMLRQPFHVTSTLISTTTTLAAPLKTVQFQTLAAFLYSSVHDKSRSRLLSAYIICYPLTLSFECYFPVAALNEFIGHWFLNRQEFKGLWILYELLVSQWSVNKLAFCIRKLHSSPKVKYTSVGTWVAIELEI